MGASRVLGIFAKAPRAGLAKTRLAEETSPEWAAQVANAFLSDTVARTADPNVRRVIAFSPDSSHSYFRSHFPGVALEPQGEGDLGQRLQRFFDRQFTSLSAHIVVIGTDSPTLPLAYIYEAFEWLNYADVVFGPAADGGYYLIGCARRITSIFEGIAWGTATVMQDTMARLDDSYRLAVLPPWYDVDTLADWHMLAGHVAALRRAGVDPRAARTEELISGVRAWSSPHG